MVQLLSSHRNRVAAWLKLVHMYAAAGGQPLKRAPAWLNRPCGVAFGFGNRLVSWSNSTAATQGAQQGHTDSVYITQVVHD